MRLRPRPPRAPGSDWVQARAAGSWTTVGNLDAPAYGVVDPAGLVAIAGRSWSLDWWIGAEDRWHVPAREVAVRQALIGSSPVVETRVRVPSGDAVQRAYGARDASGAEALVVEVRNESKVPFAVALGVRPYDLGGRGRVERVALDGTDVLVDGGLAVVLPRSPGRLALSTAEGGDAATAVFDGDAEPVRSAAVRCPDGLATAALLFPLAHTAVLRVVLPLTPGRRPDLTTLPDGDQVASGWAVQARQGARFEVPDRTWREGLAASTRHLLLRPHGAAAAAALDLAGFPDEALGALVDDPSGLLRDAGPGAALHAAGWHWALTQDPDAAKALAPIVAAVVPALAAAVGDDRAVGHAALPMVAGLLDAAGERRAAEDVRAIPASGTGPPEPDDPATLLADASPTWTWPAGAQGHSVAANGAVVTAVRRLLVQEHAAGLALTPVVPDAWLGQGWEVHGAPTTAGRLSYAIRWHGERPALLWELEPIEGAPPVPLTVPALDPAWSSEAPSGEALLAPVPVPERPRRRRGLTIPVTIEPTPRRSP